MTTSQRSPLQTLLSETEVELPALLKESNLKLLKGDPTSSIGDQEAIKRMFPNIFGSEVVSFDSDTPDTGTAHPRRRVGAILSGGQAPGGHNVISGLFDAIKSANPESQLVGFLGGPGGLLEGNHKEITREIIDAYRNTGGFDILGSGRTKLDQEAQFVKVRQVCEKAGVDSLVVIGGDDSNTNAALLAEYLLEKGASIQVVGVPKTIDGDLKNKNIETSFGFDTAVKVYSELVGNISKDANSAKKYWHFIRLMGRSASHITLEVALQTHPNITLISEEILSKNVTLDEIINDLCATIVERAHAGENFGVVLVPEGLVEFIPEVKRLISELNTVLAEDETYFKSLTSFEAQSQFVNHHLSKESSFVFSSLPNDIQHQMLAERDEHGNVSVSKIETEKLLIELCSIVLSEMKAKDNFPGKFSAQHHFFGYEGRCAAPSHFDAKYSYALGCVAFQLLSAGLSGYMAVMKNTSQAVEKWIPGGVPITMMMNMEERKGKLLPVIQKSLVDLEGEPFRVLQSNREAWKTAEDYHVPGPIQYFGPKEVCDAPTLTLTLEHPH